MKQQSGLQMTQSLNSFLQNAISKQHAVEHGTRMHVLLQKIVIDDESGDVGDKDIVAKIKYNPDLVPFFLSTAKTEVPIAGFIDNHFVSRRIDRLLIDHNNKTIRFIDYKTDLNTTDFYDKYKIQLTEYAKLLKSAYPKYKISGFILWLNNWVLEQIFYYHHYYIFPKQHQVCLYPTRVLSQQIAHINSLIYYQQR